MSTLQSAHQYRQTHWSFEIGEEGGSVTLKRQEGRQAKKHKYKTHTYNCKACSKQFTCISKGQQHCSHQCYSKHRARIPAMIPCMVCLQGLGFGIKAIGRVVAMGHVNVKSAMMRAGVYNPKGSMKAAGNREFHSCRTNAVDAGRTPKIRRAMRALGPANQMTPIQRTRRLLRNQITRMCVHIRAHREMRTEQYVGCSFEEAKRRIESQFTRGMTWDNCGSFWHLDHIVPLSSFDLNERRQRLLANHISNLRPLKAKENIQKGNKILADHQFDLVAI